MASQTLHINLLQRRRPQHLVAWAIVGALVLTVALLALFGRGEWLRYARATAQRDATAQQLKAVQQQLDALSQQQARSADAIALRTQIDALRPQAATARAIAQALGAADGDRAGPFTRVLAALVGAREDGVWLTGLSVAEGGRKIELAGQAGDGAGVLQFARRVNAALQPMGLRLDTLEMQPPTGAPAGATPGAAVAAPTGVSFRLK